ncbi:MAG: hypothetical protein ACJ763_09555 [Bdellovibrionia bacterium]
MKTKAAQISLVTLALAIVAVPQHHLAKTHRQATRGLAAAFGQYANLPGSVNVASILNTFQSPNNILPMNALFNQIQSQMLAGIPAGTPVWDGHGQLPGAVGTAGFNPSFHFDSSGCNVLPMTFYDVYQPSVNLPTVWCGAVSQGQTKVAGISDSLNGSGLGSGGLVDAGQSQAPQVSVGRSVF